MNKQPKLTNYVSDIDQFLQKFDQEHSLTPSQQAEKNKANRITQLRDGHSVDSEPKTPLWKGF